MTQQAHRTPEHAIPSKFVTDRPTLMVSRLAEADVEQR